VKIQRRTCFAVIRLRKTPQSSRKRDKNFCRVGAASWTPTAELTICRAGGDVDALDEVIGICKEDPEVSLAARHGELMRLHE
jgi:hypothetical protein